MEAGASEWSDQYSFVAFGTKGHFGVILRKGWYSGRQ